MRSFRILAVVAMCGLSLGSPAMAQELPEIPDIKAEDVSVGQVVSFVNAMIAAERVRQEYLAKIEVAETDEEISELIAEADTAGMAAVDNVVGISVGEYMAIARAAQGNEELETRISTRLEQMRQSQAWTVEPKEKPEGEAAQE